MKVFSIILLMAKTKKTQPPKSDFDVFLQKVGEHIRELRIANGFSNYEHFAYEHNIGRSQYGKYEKGTDDLRLSSLYKVIQSLDVSFEEFFKGME